MNAVFLLVTVCGLGKIKCAPGTFGSLAAFPLSFFIFQLVASEKLVIRFYNFTHLENYLITIPIAILATSILIFFVGLWASNIYIRGKKENDPSEVVIDELAGQMLVIACTMPSIAIIMGSKVFNNFNPVLVEFVVLFLLPLIFFRIFDIFKPWPIKNIEEYFPNAFGIMIDDIVAAMFAIVIHYSIIFLTLDLYSYYLM